MARSALDEAERGYKRAVDAQNDALTTTLERFGQIESVLTDERRVRDEAQVRFFCFLYECMCVLGVLVFFFFLRR